MKTLSEKLHDKIGSKVLCDGCKKKKVFTDKWKMSSDETIYCETCQPSILGKGKVLVSV